ncbi:MAG: alpha-glucan phosphorylase, partial [Treponema sp.]|nr:alpha-glucan phosphorylase [Treponema sp.]
DEAYVPEVGWSIGHGEYYQDEWLQDEIESKALYDLLERDIVPMFYDRGKVDNLPRGWIGMMKDCMRQIGQSMSSHRMLLDYCEKFYFPALKNHKRQVKSDYAESKSLAAYFHRLREAWAGLRIVKVEANNRPVMQRGDGLHVTAYIDLGKLSPEEVLVELYHGRVSNQNAEIVEARHTEMKWEKAKDGLNLYHVKVECQDTGFQGHTVRIMPKHEALVHPYQPGLIKWA